MGKTIEEIASELGVSVTTVRLVLLGKARQYRISKQTEERIKNYTEEHGYQINHTARSLRLQRTDSLALIVPRLSNHFFAALAEQLEIRCRDAGLQLFISCCYDNPATQLQLIQNFRQRNIDGLFVVPSNQSIPPKAAQLFNQRMVLLDRDFGFADYPIIITDNQNSSQQLARTLHSHAANRGIDPSFLFIAGNPEMPSIASRLTSFQAALAEVKLASNNLQIRTAPRNGFSEGMEAMSEFLRTNNHLPSALVTSSIPLFEGALHALREHHGLVPKDMLLATFDDHTMLDFLPNPLCSVRQDSTYMVNAAFAEMEQLIAGVNQPERHIAAMTLISRNMD